VNCRFSGKQISSLVTVVPPREVRFEDEIGDYGFPRAKSMKLGMVVGFDRHRLADAGTCASDLCLFGLQCLLAGRYLKPEEIDALVFVSQSPDHLIPPTSNLVQCRAGLAPGNLLCGHQPGLRRIRRWALAGVHDVGVALCRTIRAHDGRHAEPSRGKA
jgi:hypothetical protein